MFHLSSSLLPFSYSSEERTKAIQYILHQREQIDQLTTDKKSVNIFFSRTKLFISVFLSSQINKLNY
jgi:hypothetical protein